MQSNLKRQHAGGGFTLIELLVALALLAVLSTALYQTYFMVVRAEETTQQRIETRREVSSTLDLLRREISAVFYLRANKRLHFVVEDRDLFGKPASTLDFTALTLPAPNRTPSTDVMQVRYRALERDNRFIMTRSTGNPYLKEPVTNEYPQVESLESFLVECFDGEKWVKSWDTAINSALPKAVRVTLRFKEGDRVAEHAAIIVPRVKGL